MAKPDRTPRRSPVAPHTEARPSRRRNLLALVAALAVLGTLVAAPAFGAPTKYYTPSVTPACVTPGSTTTFALKLTNSNPPGGQSFGSADISVPVGFTAVSVTTPPTFDPASTTKSWTATLVGSTIELRSAKSAVNDVQAGESVIVHFTATAPSPTSLPAAYTWNTAVKQSNDFKGTNNDFFLAPGTSFPTTTVATSCAPTADNDSYSVNEDGTLNVTAPGVLDGDSDPAGGPLTAVLVPSSGPGNAAVFALNANGSFTYSPTPNFNGSDTFKYKAYNGSLYSAEATVTITVNPVNDAPAATAQSVPTDEDTAKAITLAGTDADADPLTFKVTSLPENGTLYEGTGTGGTEIVSAPHALSGTAVTYDPDPNYNGADGFQFKANDGTVDSAAATVSITVGPVNDGPVANDDSYSMLQAEANLTVSAPGVLGNDTDADGDPLTVADGDPSTPAVTDPVSGPSNGTLTLNTNGSFTYTPNVGFAGKDSFTYKANDGTADSNVAATVEIFVATGVLDCDASNTADVEGLGDLADVHVTRLENTDPETECVAKNYALTTAAETPPGGGDTTNVVTFDQQAIPGQESAHYLMEITWTYAPRNPVDDPSNPATVGGRTFYIDYGDGTAHEAELCLDVTYDGLGNVTSATHPDGVPWCITGQSYTIDGDGNIVLTQYWDGLGDPKMW